MTICFCHNTEVSPTDERRTNGQTVRQAGRDLASATVVVMQ